MTFTGITCHNSGKGFGKTFTLKNGPIFRWFRSRRELKRYLAEIRKCEKGIV